MNAERARLAEADKDVPWRAWGPYLSERQWGTVREDYSAGGDAWSYLPHDHARSRAYRWGEDGLAGLCDEDAHLCFALALWNGKDPILKERIFGLTGPEGNHGEDAKEYWWYTDATPTASWLQWRYVYPQAEFPYDQLVEVNRGRSRTEPEFELLDTGVFDDDRYWDVCVEYAKAAVDDLCVRITATNVGPDPATLHLLPHVWFRNTWSWRESEKPSVSLGEDGTLVTFHPEIPRDQAVVNASPGATPLFCENETNTRRLFGEEDSPAYPKDGINDHVLHGAATVNPEQKGTKAALWYQREVAPGETWEIRLRIARESRSLGQFWEKTMQDRQQEADEFYADVAPADATPEEAMVMRQAFAGMIWGKQHFRFDVEAWLDGDPIGPTPPPNRGLIRNGRWRDLDADDVISMPDPWEYPWFAAWDLAFHCITFAHIDPSFAKDQLLLLTRNRYLHPSGAFPAYEWTFDDVNPPVHALAALAVHAIDGRRDARFLNEMFQKLLLNFTWWVNQKDAYGDNLFEGGFLGLDNIGMFDRSRLPSGMVLEQADATAWMGIYCLSMLAIGFELIVHDKATDPDEPSAYESICHKFMEHFLVIAEAINDEGLWDEEDAFYYDHIRVSGSEPVPVKVRSMVGLLALAANVVTPPSLASELSPQMRDEILRRMKRKSRLAPAFRQLAATDNALLSLVPTGGGDVARLLRIVFDEGEFLSPYGLRSVSKAHEGQPAVLELQGQHFSVEYKPAESDNAMFGGNSNWRGPIWFPVNYLIIEALISYYQAAGPDLKIEYPSGSGQERNLFECADDLSRRLVSIFLQGADGRRPVFGPYEKMQTDPRWHDRLLFHEYFHGDTGMGLGASHQTGWTGLVAHLIADRTRRTGDNARGSRKS